MLVLRLELTQLVALRSAPLDFLQNNPDPIPACV
jgi:hypothetical protein